MRERLESYVAFYRKCASLLRRFPEESITIARNHARSGPVVEDAERQLGAVSRPWIASLRRPDPPPSRPLRHGVLEAGAAPLSSIAIAAEGCVAVAGSEDGSVRVWNPLTEKLIWTFRASEDEVTSVAVDARGAIALSSRNRDAAEVWDLERGTLRCTLPHGGKVSAVAVTADGRFGITAGTGGLKVWDLEDGACARRIETGIDSPSALAVSADGRTAVLGGLAETLRVLDLRTGERRFDAMLGYPSAGLPPEFVYPYAANVAAAAITPDGRIAVVGCSDSTVRVWDLERRAERHRLAGGMWELVSVAVSADGKLAAAAPSEPREVVYIWDLETGRLLRRLWGDSSSSRATAMSADGRWVLSAGSGPSIIVWDLLGTPTPEDPERYPIGAVQACISPRGDVGLSAGACVDGRIVTVWDMAPGEALKKILLGPRSRVALHPGSRMLLAADESGKSILELWQISPLSCLRLLDSAPLGQPLRPLGFSPDGRRAVVARGSQIFCWDLPSGALQAEVDLGESGTSALLPDGNTVLALRKGKIDVWSIFERARVREIEAPSIPDPADAPASPLPDGRHIVVAAREGGIELWDLAAARRAAAIETPPAREVAATPDGAAVLAIHQAERTVRLWELSTGRCLAVYPLFEPPGCLSAVGGAARAISGTLEGELHLLEIRGLPEAPRTAIAVRPWRMLECPPGSRPGKRGEPVFLPGEEIPGRSEERLSAVCAWCGGDSGVPARAEDAIASIGSSSGLSSLRSPCGVLPPEAWEETTLLGECSLCGKPLRFAPFAVGPVSESL